MSLPSDTESIAENLITGPETAKPATESCEPAYKSPRAENELPNVLEPMTDKSKREPNETRLLVDKVDAS
jgi:hypothetical protein